MSNSVAAPTSGSNDVPYPPSWIDRLSGWIENLPGPIWLAYLLGVLACALLINAIFWIDGSAPVGSFDPLITSYAVLSVYWPALYQYLTHFGSRALRAFRPLLDAPDAECGRIDYELRKLPRRVGWLTIPLGYTFAILQTLDQPPSFGGVAPLTALPRVGDIAITGFMTSAFLCLVIRSVRQLRMISRLHARAANISLLELDPAHAFSGLTARTGIGVILLLGLAYAVDPLGFVSAQNAFLSITTTLMAIAIFVLPIMGIQNRIKEEKQRALHQIHLLLQAARDRLHSQVRSADYEGVGDTDSAIEALIRERELMKGVSTWPWDPGTLRGFASALLLPLFLWLVTRLLERFV